MCEISGSTPDRIILKITLKSFVLVDIGQKGGLISKIAIMDI